MTPYRFPESYAGSGYADVITGFGAPSARNTGLFDFSPGVPIAPGVPAASGGASMTGAQTGQNNAPAAKIGLLDRFKNTIFYSPDQGGGLNLDNIAGLANIIGGFGSLYLGFQSNKMAKKAFNLQSQAYRTNLANQIKSYNTALEDRIRARNAYLGKPESETQSYIDKNRLGD